MILLLSRQRISLQVHLGANHTLFLSGIQVVSMAGAHISSEWLLVDVAGTLISLRYRTLIARRKRRRSRDKASLRVAWQGAERRVIHLAQSTYHAVSAVGHLVASLIHRKHTTTSFPPP
jgi:hypothetical protein